VAVIDAFPLFDFPYEDWYAQGYDLIDNYFQTREISKFWLERYQKYLEAYDEQILNNTSADMITQDLWLDDYDF
jgi:hypothetical protein